MYSTAPPPSTDANIVLIDSRRATEERYVVMGDAADSMAGGSAGDRCGNGPGSSTAMAAGSRSTSTAAPPRSSGLACTISAACRLRRRTMEVWQSSAAGNLVL
jgi:uncharacterized protein YcfJ